MQGLARLTFVPFWVAMCMEGDSGRGLHSSTFQLNLSRF